MTFKCCLCGKETKGWDKEGKYGNNHYPLKTKGKCCNKCNAKKVIPARLGMVSE